MQKTWVPRGTQTAQNLYNIDEGWTTHNEMNVGLLLCAPWISQ